MHRSPGVPCVPTDTNSSGTPGRWAYRRIWEDSDGDSSDIWVCTPAQVVGSSLLRWAGLDDRQNRGRFRGHTIVRHGDGVRQRRLVSHHFDALHEVADEGLALGERTFLQEVPEVRNVLRYLLGVGKGNPALLKLSGGGLSCSLQLLFSMPQREDAGGRRPLGLARWSLGLRRASQAASSRPLARRR